MIHVDLRNHVTENRSLTMLLSHCCPQDGFVQFFHEEDPEFGVRGALMTLAGMAGIGAGLAFLIR